MLWNEYKAANPRLKGLVTDENRYLLHLKEPFGEKRPEEIASLDVDRVRIRLLKSHKPATVFNVLELLRRIANYGVDSGRCAPLPFRFVSAKGKHRAKAEGKPTVTLPSVNNKRTEHATEEQLVALLNTCSETEDRDGANLVRLALFTGMRRGEIIKLRREDVDLRRGFVTLRDPKGEEDQVLPLSDDARNVLTEQAGRSSHPKYLFPTLGGTGHINKDVATAKAREIVKAAGLAGTGFRPLHGLRHTYASILANSGDVDLYTLQKLLTHKSSEMTARYAHLRDEALRRGAAVVGQAIEAAKEVGERNREEVG